MCVAAFVRTYALGHRPVIVRGAAATDRGLRRLKARLSRQALLGHHSAAIANIPYGQLFGREHERMASSLLAGSLCAHPHIEPHYTPPTSRRRQLRRSALHRPSALAARRLENFPPSTCSVTKLTQELLTFTGQENSQG